MEWRSGGVVEWWSGGVVEWWSGGVEDSRPGCLGWGGFPACPVGARCLQRQAEPIGETPQTGVRQDA
jgi:hypothetical protein